MCLCTVYAGGARGVNSWALSIQKEPHNPDQNLINLIVGDRIHFVCAFVFVYPHATNISTWPSKLEAHTQMRNQRTTTYKWHELVGKPLIGFLLLCN